jgi:hypothetical protein
VFNTTFQNISFITFVAEIGVPREIHRRVPSHWQTLSRLFYFYLTFVYNCYVPTYHRFLRQRLLLKYQNAWNIWTFSRRFSRNQRCFMLCTTYTNVWSIICPLEVRCLTLLSKIFHLLLLWRKLEYPEKSTDL